MPATISYDGLPHACAAIVIVPIHVSLITHWSGILGCVQDVDGFTCFRAVEVPDIDLAIVGARVDIPAICAAGGREMATYEGLKDAVAAEGDQGAIVGVWAVIFHVVGREAVVKVCGVVLPNLVNFDGISVLGGLTCGFILSARSVEIMLRRSQSLHVWSLPLEITYRPSPFESM